MQVLLPPQTWVLKKELLYIPFFGWALALIKPIAINRKDKLSALKQLIKQGSARLKENISILIFPEGTRVSIGKTKPFSRSGAALAIETSTNILPIAHNAGKFWPRGPWIKSPGTVQIIIGKEISVKNNSSSTLTKEIEGWINNTKKKID